MELSAEDAERVAERDRSLLELSEELFPSASVRVTEEPDEDSPYAKMLRVRPAIPSHARAAACILIMLLSHIIC